MHKTITIYDKDSGQIIKTLTGRAPEKCLAGNELYIEGEYFEDEYRIVGGNPVKKSKQDIQEENRDKKFDLSRIKSIGVDDIDKELIDFYGEGFDVSNFFKDNYIKLRAETYPSIYEFIDANVKINSSDKDEQKEGEVQLKNYYKTCANIKKKFPKS